jgi:hypothetical protein
LRVIIQSFLALDLFVMITVFRVMVLTTIFVLEMHSTLTLFSFIDFLILGAYTSVI